MVELEQEQTFTPVDMPRDGAGNIAYKHGNFFQSKDHADGLPKPRRAHERKEWDKMHVDLVLSRPAPSWQLPGSRYGLIGRIITGPYFELGYRGHCYACGAYFLELDWAMEHVCPKETEFRDATNREIRDYKGMRKVAKQFAREEAQFTAQKQSIFTSIKNLIMRNR